MPSTFVGLVIFIAFLTPGLLHYVQRRAFAPQRRLSPIVETATLATISLATNLIAVGLFGLVRSLWPAHTPDVGRLLRDGSTYVEDRPAYIVTWGAALLAASCAMAVTAARWEWFRNTFTRPFAPVIVDVSAWYHVFADEQITADGAPARIYVGCDMRDGSYVAGVLDWYSTETDDTPDRDIVLGPPLSVRQTGQEDAVPLDGFERVVLSARDIQAMYVSWIRPESAELKTSVADQDTS